MIKQFQKSLSVLKITKATPVLIAVSGGVDSMVLLKLCSDYFQHYAIAHCNFNLRGVESDADEQFVKEQAANFQSQFFTERFNTKEVASQQKISIQMAARKLRYEWLEKIRAQYKFHFILTAHHQDDSIETVLLNLIKGTGIHGLHGIQPHQGKIIRPLLFSNKSDIEKFAKDNKIFFREDLSNLKTDYQRNFIRKKIIPLFEELNPSFSKTFSKNIQHFTEAEDLFNEAISGRKKKIISVRNGNPELNIASLLSNKSPRTLLYEILNAYNFDESIVEQLFDSLLNESGKEFFSATHRVVLDRNRLIILSNQKTEFPVYLINELGDKKYSAGKFEIEIRLKSATSRNRNGLLELDADKINAPVILRPWKAGDYFHPEGMQGKKKKLSDFFVSEKLSLNEKEEQYVLEDSFRKIICVIGRRVDHHFSVSNKTKKYLTVQVNEK